MNILEIKNAIQKFAISYPVKSIDLFGSYAVGENTDASDIDLLVEFDKNVASLFDLIGLKLDIEDALMKNVDIVSAPLKDNSILKIKKMVRIYDK